MRYHKKTKGDTQLIVAIIVLVLLTMAVGTKAGDIEADVIGETFYVADRDTADVVEYKTDVEEAYEIFMDTTARSYCETYAAASAFIMDTVSKQLEIRDGDLENTPLLATDWVIAYEVVWDQLPALERRCRDEA